MTSKWVTHLTSETPIEKLAEAEPAMTFPYELDDFQKHAVQSIEKNEHVLVSVPTGAGKTSLARSITSACRRIEGLKNVELIAEYARRYISKHGSVDEIWEQYRIMDKQIEWEDNIPQDKTDLIVTDSPIHQGFLYTCDLLTNKPKDIMVYNDIFKKLSKLNENQPRYDAIFHLTPIIKPIKDGVRPKEHFDDKWRIKNDNNLKVIFSTLFKPKKLYTIDNADMEYRTNYVISAIKNINK